MGMCRLCIKRVSAHYQACFTRSNNNGRRIEALIERNQVRKRDLMIWNTRISFHPSVFWCGCKKACWKKMPFYHFNSIIFLLEAPSVCKRRIVEEGSRFLIIQHNVTSPIKPALQPCVSVMVVLKACMGNAGICQLVWTNERVWEDKRHSWAVQKWGMRRASLIAVLVVLMC